jgi:hypothetical protein
MNAFETKKISTSPNTLSPNTLSVPDQLGLPPTTPNQEIGGEVENQEIPFDDLINCLFEGNTIAFDNFFEGFEVYERERIRAQALKMFQEELQRRGGFEISGQM